MNNHHTGSAIVQASDLTKQFDGTEAVRDVTLNVQRGTIFGLIGPSGCGKTTTVRLLTGVYEPTSGHVVVLNQSPKAFTPETRRRIGYMPQHFVLYPGLSVWENLNFTASLYGMGWRRGRRLNELLDFVELAEHSRKLARHISGGMQRRLALASTLAHDPDLLFLDEPTAGIDPMLRRKLWDYFQTLKSKGRTLFVTTQYVGEAAYCDLVGVMSEGQLLMVDTPHQLRHRAYGGDVVDLRTAQPLDYRHVEALRRQPFVAGRITTLDDRRLRLVVDEASTAMPALMTWFQERSLDVESVEEYLPPIDDVFVELMRQHEDGREAVYVA